MSKILDKTRTHSFVLPVAKRGIDTFSFTPPDGEVYYGSHITLFESDLDSGARIRSQPARGAAGPQTIVVEWWHGPADKVGYEVEVFTWAVDPSAEAPSPTRVMTDFVPSQSGFHFANSFPPVPDITIPIPYGRIELGDASAGLCGGMVFAALDYFLAKRSISSVKQLSSGDVLFDFIVKRLLNSFNLPLGVMTYIVMMDPDYPDGETRQPKGLFAPHGRAWQTIRVEWPLIKKMLDAGQPCPLGLIRIKTKNLSKLGINHQVLAIGYEIEDDTLHLFIYDPNFPDRDDLKLSLSLAAPDQPTLIQYLAQDAPVYSFFRVNYKFRSPPV